MTTFSVAANVRAEMARRGLNQEDVGNILDIHRQGISRRLNGEVPFRVPELEKLATVFGIDVSVFFNTKSEGSK